MAVLVMYVSRFKEFEDSTLGTFELYNGTEKACTGYTLEPAGPDTTEANKDRRIPQGFYSIKWEVSSMSGKEYCNGKLPTLYNDDVSPDRKIKIHIGNYGKDTEGCLLLGTSCNKTNGYINSSRIKVKEFLEIVTDKDFSVVIKNNIEKEAT